MLATTEAFDPAVTSITGDLWQASLGGPISVTPVIVPPGRTATIPVIVAPTGTAGTTVSGVLYLDDDSLVQFGQPAVRVRALVNRAVVVCGVWSLARRACLGFSR